MKPINLRWSVRDLFMVTGATASGICVAKLNSDAAVGFCLGVLTAFVATGLIQQILFPPEPVAAGRIPIQGRRLCLGLILFCLVLAICGTFYRDLVPPPSPDFERAAYYAYSDRAAMYSEIADALWIYSLILGSLTAPGMTVSAQSTTRNRRWLRFGVSAAFLGCFLGYVSIILLSEWAIFFMFVDVAIHGVYAGMFQGPAVGTPHYVEWFGRSPQQLDEFVNWQVFSWPPLLIGLVITIWRSQSRSRSVAGDIFAAVVVIVLVIPAAINAVWLLGGAAHLVLPVTRGGWPPGWWMTIWPFLLLALYLTTRRVVVAYDSASPTARCRYWSDHMIVGWLFVAIGVCAIVENSKSAMSALKITIEALAYPGYSGALIFLIPYGLYWHRRRRKAEGPSTGRWPQIQRRQLLLFPCILGLLFSTVVLCIPFGIAALYFGT